MKKSFLIITAFLLITLIFLGGEISSANSRLYSNYIDQKNEFQNYKSVIYDLNEEQSVLKLHFLNGERYNFKLNEDAIIFDNQDVINLTDLNEGDALLVSFSQDSEIMFLERINYPLENNKDLLNLGFRDDIIINGTDISQELFFPFSENMDAEEMQLELNFEYSRFIEADSKIIIKIEDREVYLNDFAGLQKELVSEGIYQSQISFDLNNYVDNNDLNDRVIKVTVAADFQTSLNRCEEANAEIFFFRIKNDSAIKSQNEIYYDYNISNYLNFEFNQLNIHLPKELSSNTAEAYIKLKLFLERNYANTRKRVIFGDEYRADKIMNRDFKTANIFIMENDKINLDRNFNLIIGSGAVDSFISRASNLYLNDEMEVIEFKEVETLKRELSLSDLGFNSVVFNGIGEIERTVRFTGADLGVNPEKIDFYLNSEYTAPINFEAQNKDNSYLKIYFNGQLIRAHQLDYSGRIDNLHLNLPIYLFEQENNLRFVYSYYPLGRDCAADGQDFEAVISPDSYLASSGEKVDDVITFNNLLNNFYGNGKVMLDLDNKELSLKYAAGIISSFRKLDSRPLNINLEFINSDQELEIDDSFRWGIAVLPALENYNINSLVKIEDRKIDFQANSEEFIFEGESSNPSALWQLDKINGKAFSLITTSNLSKKSLDSLELLSSRINNIDFLRSLNGTLLLASDGRLTDFAADEYGVVKADQRSSLMNFYQEYKNQLFIVFLIIIIILSYLVYIKLARSQEEK